MRREALVHVQPHWHNGGKSHWQPLQRQPTRDRAALAPDECDAESSLKRHDSKNRERRGLALGGAFENGQLVEDHLLNCETACSGGGVYEAAGITKQDDDVI